MTCLESPCRSHYEDRGLLEARLLHHTRDQHTMPEASSSEPARRHPSSWRLAVLFIAFFALLTGPTVLFLGYQTGQAIETFRDQGVPAQARVIDKRRLMPHRGCVAVSYFDASVLEGGKLQRSESCDLIGGGAWSRLQQGGVAEILFLPKQTERFILKSALSPDNRPLLHNTRFGIAMILLGLIAVALARGLPGSRQ